MIPLGASLVIASSPFSAKFFTWIVARLETSPRGSPMLFLAPPKSLAAPSIVPPKAIPIPKSMKALLSSPIDQLSSWPETAPETAPSPTLATKEPPPTGVYDKGSPAIEPAPDNRLFHMEA